MAVTAILHQMLNSMRHRKALNMDMCLIDATHYGTENIIVPVLRDYIQDEANKAGYEITVKASKVNGQVFDYIK